MKEQSHWFHSSYFWSLLFVHVIRIPWFSFVLYLIFIIYSISFMRRDFFTTVPSTNLIIVTRGICAGVLPTSLNHGLGSCHGRPTPNKGMVTLLKNLRPHTLPVGIKSLSFSLKFLKIFSKEEVLGQNNFSLSNYELQRDVKTPLAKPKCHCTIHTDVFWDCYIFILPVLPQQEHLIQ